MAFWRCYYHMIWAVKQRQALITPDVEKIVFEAIAQKSEELKCSLLAMNGISDHIHVAVSMPPTLAIVDWVKHVKGVSSREVNVALPANAQRFRWQEGFGVLTFGVKKCWFCCGIY